MKQIVVQPQSVGFCRFHQRIDDCTRLRPLGCIGKEPSLPANDKRADGIFYLVVADFNLTMLKKRAEVSLLILSTGIVMCFSPKFFKFTCFLDSSFSSTMDKYRTFKGRCQRTGLLSGYLTYLPDSGRTVSRAKRLNLPFGSIQPWPYHGRLIFTERISQSL